MKHTAYYLRGAALACVLQAGPAFALDDAAVMKQLAAMQEQMKAMQDQIVTLKQELGTAKERAVAAERTAQAVQVQAAQVAKLEPAAGAAALPKPPKPAELGPNDVKVTLTPGPKFETGDGSTVIKLGGFAQVDAGMFSDDRRDHPDGTNLRRARLNVTGTIAKDWNFKLENDFANNASALTDVYLEYAGIKDVSIMAGQFKEPFGLETLTSDLFTTFTERASLLAFAPDRNIGLAVGVNGADPIFGNEGGRWTATLGGFGAGTGVASTDDEQKDITGRITYAPIANKTEVLHFGVAGAYRIPDSNGDAVRIQSRPETRLTSSQAVDTGSITRVDHSELLGLEAAGVYGPFSVQGEYMQQHIERDGGFADVDLSGYYVEASYFLTGESRTYQAKTGKFDRTRPQWPLSFSEGNWGAWQVAARWSDLDLTDNVVRGGELKDLTLALKWIPVANVNLSANYIKVDTDSLSVTPNDNPDVYVVRAQFDF